MENELTDRMKELETNMKYWVESMSSSMNKPVEEILNSAIVKERAKSLNINLKNLYK